MFWLRIINQFVMFRVIFYIRIILFGECIINSKKKLEMKKYLFLLVFLFPIIALSKTIKGVVMNTKHVSLIGANVYWQDS